MNRLFSLVAGLFLGAFTGAVVVLLMAPRSGEEERQLIQARVQEVLDEGRRAAETRRLELVGQLEELKRSAPPA